MTITKFTSVSILVVLFTLLLLPQMVLAQANPNPLDAACQTIANESAACQEAASGGNSDPVAGPDGVISTAANILAIIAGVAAVVWVILGGLALITAGGDAQKIATSKRKVIGGIVGLVIIALAWAIVGVVTGTILQT